MSEEKYFSTNINRLRISKRMSQSDLAESANVSLHTIFRAESKGIIPRGGNISKIARALGVSEADLFKDNTSDKSELSTKSDLLTAIYTKAPFLSKEQLEYVLEFIQDLEKHDKIEEETLVMPPPMKTPKSS